MSLETVLSSLAGVLGDDLLDLSFERDHLASVDLDVCCLAFEAAPQQWFVVRHGWPPLPSTSPHSPVWTHARTSRWSSRIDSVIAQAKRIARAGPSSAQKEAVAGGVDLVCSCGKGGAVEFGGTATNPLSRLHSVTRTRGPFHLSRPGRSLVSVVARLRGRLAAWVVERVRLGPSHEAERLPGKHTATVSPDGTRFDVEAALAKGQEAEKARAREAQA